MRRRLEAGARIDARSERGFTLVAIILGTLAAATAAVAVAAGVAIHNNQKRNPNPNNFSISITHATAVRDTSDLPVVTVSYRINFNSAEAARAQVTPVHAKCYVVDGSERSYVASDDTVQPHNVFEFGDAVLALGSDNRAVEGAVDVRCFLFKSGATLSQDRSTVVIPSQTSTGGTGTGSAQVDGKYGLVFTRAEGSETDCVIDGEREITVTALTATTVKVSLNDTDAFESPLSADLKYSGSLALNPGFADYYGRMDGQFASTANGIQVGGTMHTNKPACTFTFQGSLH